MLDEAEIELVADLVQSPGWQLLWYRVLPGEFKKSVGAGLAAIRKRDLPGASESIAKLDGAVQVAVEAYKAAGAEVPKAILDMRG